MQENVKKKFYIFIFIDFFINLLDFLNCSLKIWFYKINN